MRSLRFKLLAGFIAIAAIAVVVVALAATRATDIAFASYVRQGQSQRLQSLQVSLAAFYARQQSWVGVQPVLDADYPMGRMMGQGMGRGAQNGSAGLGMMDQQIIVADAQGTIVASTGTAPASARLTPREIDASLPIGAGGKTVGYLLAQGPGVSTFSTLEQQFISSVNQGLLAASILAGVAAIAAGLFIARRLTAPLVSMTQAAQMMARGDLAQRVKVESDDEVGNLAEAFNTMASSLARAEDLRRNLVADVAHELRTPIAVLRADLEALQDGVYQPTPERLTALQEETGLLSRMVADLHDLSLADAGQLTMERRLTDLSQVCRQTVLAMTAQAAHRGISLLNGQTDGDATSDVDPDRIGQVLRNLISNALRYTPSGGSVTVDCRRDAKENVIEVRDTGLGIKPEDVPYVFDRFYRGEKSRSRATGGAGLGLAIVKQIVEAHGGTVSVVSTLGQGAVFTIRLPGHRV